MRSPSGNSQYYIEIRLKDHLDRCWSVWFEGFTVDNLAEDAVLISGFITDQAALFGLLNRIRDLNLKILALAVRTAEEV